MSDGRQTRRRPFKQSAPEQKICPSVPQAGPAAYLPCVCFVHDVAVRHPHRAVALEATAESNLRAGKPLGVSRHLEIHVVV
jgi:hypothetical protein